jgi:hypothetical protein
MGKVLGAAGDAKRWAARNSWKHEELGAYL